jgi:hypothetical protein
VTRVTSLSSREAFHVNFIESLPFGPEAERAEAAQFSAGPARKMKPTPTFPKMQSLAAALSVALGVFAPSPVLAVSGETVFVRGEVLVRGADGRERLLKAGDQVRPGEVLRAGEAGFAHLRFPDGGFVGLRPGARFVVESYSTDEGAEGGVNVRYRLDAGSVRAITGASVERNKSRFRLNTPVAAVGVRGTDYVVQTTDRLTRASVNSGAIVLAPFGNGCEAGGLGACDTSSARALAAGAGGAYIEYHAGARAPEIKKSAVPALTPAAPDEPAAARRRDAAVVPGEAPSAALAGNPASVDTAARALAETVAAEVSLPPPPPPEVVWGRWSELAAASPTVSSQVGRGYAPVFSNPAFGLLAREPLSGMPTFGTVGFGLSGAEAEVRTAAGGVTPATVSDGTLTIDFGGRQFETRLSVSAPGLEDRLSAAGRVTPQGSFVSDASRSSMQVLGVLAGPQARDAGYLFERALGDGSTLFGATAWRR